MTNTINMNQIHVGGADVEISGGVYVDVKISLDDCEFEDLVGFLHHASSPRVKVQAKLRALSTEDLRQAERLGFRIRLKDLYGRSPQRQVVRVLTLDGALREYPDVVDFIDACENAGWTKLASVEKLTELHVKTWPTDMKPAGQSAE